MQEVDVVASELVYAFPCCQGWCFQALVADQSPDDRPILLLDVAAVVLAIGPTAGEGDVLVGAEVQQCGVQELTATIGVQPEDGGTAARVAACGVQRARFQRVCPAGLRS